ncbi:MAG: ATP-dependent zinc protease [Gammaproteobacteria bacterium]
MGHDAKGRVVLGWREWVSLPELGITAIKAKVDTGARTSALHAFHVELYRRGGGHWVRFAIHPVQKRADIELLCNCKVIDQRLVSDSGGHRERRYVINTPVRIADRELPIEITLTDRDTMNFRMLLGRTALRKGFLVDPRRSYLAGNPPGL